MARSGSAHSGVPQSASDSASKRELPPAFGFEIGIKWAVQCCAADAETATARPKHIPAVFWKLHLLKTSSTRLNPPPPEQPLNVTASRRATSRRCIRRRSAAAGSLRATSRSTRFSFRTASSQATLQLRQPQPPRRTTPSLPALSRKNCAGETGAAAPLPLLLAPPGPAQPEDGPAAELPLGPLLLPLLLLRWMVRGSAAPQFTVASSRLQIKAVTCGQAEGVPFSVRS